MFGTDHYVPILRGKQGEFWSLRDSEDRVLQSLTPLLEVAEIPWDYENDRPAKTVDEHLEKLPEYLIECWGGEHPILVDFYLIPDEERLASGAHPIAHIFEEGRNRSLRLIPVTGRDRNQAAQDAAIEQANTDGFGLGLRLTDEDFGNPQQIKRYFDRILTQLNSGAEGVDIVLDFGSISPDAANTVQVAMETTVRSLPYIQDWRSVVVAATAFPENMSPFSADSINMCERTEWMIWQRLRQRDNEIPRIPTFGDYAINHPSVPDVDPRFMRMSANLRYTSDEDWVILKGRNVRRHGFEQFNDLCRKLVDRPEYRGRDFSWGDDYIFRCAQGTEGPGNATSWRRVGTTHHLALVVDQMTNFGAP